MLSVTEKRGNIMFHEKKLSDFSVNGARKATKTSVAETVFFKMF